MFQASVLFVKMVKTDSLAGPEINQGRPFRNGPDPKTVTTDSEWLTGETVTEPDPLGEGRVLKGTSHLLRIICASGILERMSGELFYFRVTNSWFAGIP